MSNPFDNLDDDGGIAVAEPASGNIFDEYDAPPLEQPAEESHLPPPEGALKSAIRSGLSEIIPAIGTGGGALVAGTLATPETAGVGTLPAAIAGAAAGGYAGKKLQDWLMGQKWKEENEAQLEANRRAHEIASGAGAIVPTLVSLAGGVGAAPKLLGIGKKAGEEAFARAIAAGESAATAKLAAKVATERVIAEQSAGWGARAMGIRGAEAGLAGARLGASQTAQQPDPTLESFADNVARSAITFGPLGIVPHMDKLVKAVGAAVPQAAITALSSAAYESIVHDKPFDVSEIKDKSIAEIIPFALFNTVAHGIGAANKLVHQRASEAALAKEQQLVTTGEKPQFTKPQIIEAANAEIEDINSQVATLDASNPDNAAQLSELNDKKAAIQDSLANDRHADIAEAYGAELIGEDDATEQQKITDILSDDAIPHHEKVAAMAISVGEGRLDPENLPEETKKILTENDVDLADKNAVADFLQTDANNSKTVFDEQNKGEQDEIPPIPATAEQLETIQREEAPPPAPVVVDQQPSLTDATTATAVTALDDAGNLPVVKNALIKLHETKKAEAQQELALGDKPEIKLQKPQILPEHIKPKTDELTTIPTGRGHGAATSDSEIESEHITRSIASGEPIDTAAAKRHGIKVPEHYVEDKKTGFAAPPFEVAMRQKAARESTPEGREARAREDHAELEGLNKSLAGPYGGKFKHATLVPREQIKDERFKQFAKVFESLFGRRIITYTQEGKGDTLHGIVSPSNSKTIFVNANSKIHPVAIMGHEFMHSLELTNKPLYDEFVKGLIGSGVITQKMTREFGMKHWGKDSYDPSQFFEETLHNLIGDRLLSSSLLSDLAEKNPNLFQKIATELRKWIATLLNKLRDFKTKESAEKYGIKDFPNEEKLKVLDERLKDLLQKVAEEEHIEPEPELPASLVEGISSSEIPVKDLTLSKDVPQFKSDANEKGIVEPLEGEFDRRGLAPIQVWQRADGRMEVISGRHRFDLAQRTGQETIPAQIYKESEGFTKRDAMTLDAELNIRDGQGSIKDYANYFRNAGISREDAEARGLLARAKGKDGWAIGQEASDEVFNLHQNGRITDAAAAAIASAAPNKANLQAVGAKALLNGTPIDVSVNLMRAVQAKVGSQESQEDMFGFDDSAMKEMEEQAKRATAIQREIKSDISAISGASKNPAKAAKYGVDVKDPEAVKAKIKELKDLAERWSNWPLHKDLVREASGEEPEPPKEDAIQIGQSEEILPREPEKTGGAGGELKGMGSEQQGTKPAGEGEAKVEDQEIPAPPKRDVNKAIAKLSPESLALLKKQQLKKAVEREEDKFLLGEEDLPFNLVSELPADKAKREARELAEENKRKAMAKAQAEADAAKSQGELKFAKEKKEEEEPKPLDFFKDNRFVVKDLIQNGGLRRYEDVKDAMVALHGPEIEKYVPSWFTAAKVLMPPDIKAELDHERTIKEQAARFIPHDESDDRERDVSGKVQEGGIARGRPSSITAREELIPIPGSHVGVGEFTGPNRKKPFVLNWNQRRGINLMLDRFFGRPEGSSFLLGDGAGFGKTAQMIAVLGKYKEVNPDAKILFVSQNAAILEQRIKVEAQRMGVNLDDPNIRLATYSELQKFTDSEKEYDLAIYDEAHNLKNAHSKRSMAASGINARHNIFATATPMDKPTGAPYFLSKLTGVSEDVIQQDLGFITEAKMNPKTGAMEEKHILLPGMSWDQVWGNLMAYRDFLLNDGAMIRREYPFYGRTFDISGELSPEHLEQQSIIDDYYEDMIAQSPSNRKNLNGQRLLTLRRWSEPEKLDDAVRLTQKWMNENPAGQVVIVTRTADDQFFPMELPGSVPGTRPGKTPGSIKRGWILDGAIKILNEKLAAAGIDKVSQIHTPTENVLTNEAGTGEVDKFQSGENRVAIATPQSGGTGIDLDDQIGSRPRLMIIVTKEFAGDSFEQVLGRISRQKTKSPSEVIFLSRANSIADEHANRVLGKKIKTLKAIQGGEDLDIAVGREVEKDELDRRRERMSDKTLWTRKISNWKKAQGRWAKKKMPNLLTDYQKMMVDGVYGSKTISFKNRDEFPPPSQEEFDTEYPEGMVGAGKAKKPKAKKEVATPEVAPEDKQESVEESNQNARDKADQFDDIDVIDDGTENGELKFSVDDQDLKDQEEDFDKVEEDDGSGGGAAGGGGGAAGSGTAPILTPADYISMTHRGIRIARRRLGMSTLPMLGAKRLDAMAKIAQSRITADPTLGERVVDDILSGDYQATDEEKMLLTAYAVQLKTQIDAAPPGSLSTALQFAELDRLYRAYRLDSSNWGRIGRIIQEQMAKDYSLKGLEARATRMISTQLTPVQLEQIKKDAHEFAAMDAEEKIMAHERLTRYSENAIARMKKRVEELGKDSGKWIKEALDSMAEHDEAASEAARQTLRDLQEIRNIDAELAELEGTTPPTMGGIKFAMEGGGDRAAELRRRRSELEQQIKDRKPGSEVKPEPPDKEPSPEGGAPKPRAPKGLPEPEAILAGEKTAIAMLESLAHPKERVKRVSDPVRVRYANEVRDPGDVEDFVSDLAGEGVNDDTARALHEIALKKNDEIEKARLERDRIAAATPGSMARTTVKTVNLKKLAAQIKDNKAFTTIHDLPDSVWKQAMTTLVASGKGENDAALMNGLKDFLADAGITAEIDGPSGIRQVAYGYGDVQKLPTDPVKVQLRKLRQAGLLIAHIDNVRNDRDRLPNGTERMNKDLEIRRLEKELHDTMKAVGAHYRKSPEALPGILDNVRTRLLHDIEDIEKQIAEGRKRRRPKTELEYDEPLKLLAAKKKGLMDDLNEVERLRLEKEGLTDEEKAEAELKREKALIKIAERRKKYWEDRKAAAEWEDRQEARTEPSQKVLDARLQAENAKEQFEQARELAIPEKMQQQRLMKRNNQLRTVLQDAIDRLMGKGKVRATPIGDHETLFLKEQIKNLKQAIYDIEGDPRKSSAQRTKNAERSTQRAIDELERQIAAQDFTRPPGTPVVETPHLTNLRRELEFLKQIKHAMQFVTKPSPEEMQLARYKRAILRRTADLDAKLQMAEAGNPDAFLKKTRKETQLDEEAQKLKLRFDRKNREFNRWATAEQMKNRTKMEKFWDFFPMFKRAAVLSGPVIFGKLAAATMTRGFTTVAEEIAGGAWSHILPGEVTRKAQLEGGTVTEGIQSIIDALTKDHMQMIRDAGATVTKGESDLDVASSKRPSHEMNVWGIPGRLHAMMKAPLKRFIYEQAFSKLARAYVKSGGDPQDVLGNELVNAMLASKAYKAANRSIFLQDNALVDMYKSMIKRAEGMKGTAGPGIARFMQVLLPVVRVPTNIMMEAGQYVAGVPIGLTKLAKAWHSGFDKMTPDEADSIMRNLKKGSLGSALMLFGFYSNVAGGYYNPDDRHRIGEPKTGGFRLFGVDIPSWLTHSPAFEAIQFGATMRRAIQHSGHEGSLPSAAMAAAMGLAEGTPFINEMFRVKDMQTAHGREQFFGELAKAQIEPSLIQKVAEWTDRTRPLEPSDLLTGEGVAKRAPKTFAEDLKTGIPGLRKDVALKVDSPFSPLDEDIPEAIQDYSVRGGQMPSKPERAYLEKKNGAISHRAWERYAVIRGNAVKREMLENIGLLNSLSHEEQKKRVNEINKRATWEAKQALDLK